MKIFVSLLTALSLVMLVLTIVALLIASTIHICYFSAYLYSHLMDKDLGRRFDKVMKHKKFKFINNDIASDITYNSKGDAETIYHFLDSFWSYDTTTNNFKIIGTDWCGPLYKHAVLHAVKNINYKNI